MRAAQWRYERVRRGAQGRSISPAAYARLQLSTRSVGEAAAAVLGAERRPIERAPARKPGGAGRVRKKSPAEAGHKVIGSSSSTNCGPASQPLLSGRSETRAQNCRQARSKNVEPRGWFRQARGPRQKKPRQEEAFSSAARVANLALSQSAGRLTHPLQPRGWRLVAVSAAQKKARRSGAS